MFRSPLLYGKYVAISQEDALANNDADERFPLSTSAPPVPDLRYDLHSDRLYMTYPYLPDEFDLISDGIAPLNGPLPISKYPFWESDNTCNLDEEHLGLIREKEGNVITLQRRKHVLGYGRDGRIGLRSFCSRNRALYEAFLHSYRGEMNKTSEENLKGNETKFFDDSGKIEIPTNNNLYPYRVVDYPQAGVLLGQYPLHTHISFTIEEALGHAGNPYHERFPEYQTYLEQQIASVRENTALASLAELFGETIIAMRKRDIAVEWIKANASAEPVKKACMLSKSLVPANSNVALGNEYVFNKLRKATGQIFSSIDEVHAYIRTNAGDSLDVSAEEDDFTCDIRSSDDG